MDLKEKQIIYVDNKPHIKCDVVMLPIEISKLFPGVILLDKLSNKLSQSKTGSNFDILGGYRKPQHLYITSDEQIKEDDYYLWYDGFKYSIRQNIHCKNLPGNTSDSGLKIIATTDTSLFYDGFNILKHSIYEQDILPQPSQQFIEKYIEEYNKGNIITEVLVELKSSDLDYFYDNLKVDSQNQITIRKQKDSWSREEHIKDLHSLVEYIGRDQCMNFKDYVDKWIKENL